MQLDEARDLKEKVALVTGASGGIGGETAKRLAARGVAVAVHYHSNAKAAEALVSEIKDAGGNAIIVGGDAGREDDAKRIVQETVDAFGGLNILVNNAGISTPIDFGAMVDENVDRELSANVKSVIYATQAAAPFLENGGRVVNVSSNLAYQPIPGMTLYCAAKAAVSCLTHGFAKELGSKGISVNAVAPGATKTQMTAWIPDEMIQGIADGTPLGRVAMPDDIADIIVFLASPESRWVNGRTVLADGGLL